MLIHAHVLKHLSVIVIFDIHRRQRILNNYSENNELTNQGAKTLFMSTWWGAGEAKYLLFSSGVVKLS